MRIKILLLEDEEILAKLYQKKLEESGFTVKWVNHINTVEKVILEFQPTIFLLDHSLGGEEKSGMDLIPNIKKMVPKSKIIMLSNYSDFHLKETALASGANDYLVKIDTPPSILVNYIKKL